MIFRSVVRSVNEWIRGLKPGTATVTATAGGKSATLRVTVKAKVSDRATVWYKPSKSVRDGVVLWWRVSGSTGAASRVSLKPACDGWYSVVLDASKDQELKLVFDVDGVWDTQNGTVNGSPKGYYGKGSSIAVTGGNALSGVTPGCTVKN